MSAGKVVVIVLVVIAMLFVITVALGGSHGGGNTDSPDAVNFLKGLQSKRFLTLGDKATATCAGAGQRVLVLAGSSCTITLEKRGFLGEPTRVVLIPTGLMPLGVKIDPKSGPAQDESVDPGKCFQSAVGPGGGTVTLLPSGNVTVTLQDRACP
jgi:hypothetical protein